MGITPNYDLDIDSTLGGDNASDYVIPSQKAIKSYVDNNTGSTVDQVYDPTSQAAQSGIAIAGAHFLTSSDLTNYVTTNTDQNITGVKTYVGQKRIGFKQSSSSDKLGFTLYNNNNVEKGYLEFNPTNTIDDAPLMTLGNYATSTTAITHVGFRKYSNVSGASGAYNLLAPLISNAKTPFNLTTTYTNFYLPLGFTDGTTMVTTANTGVVDLSSLLPTVGNGTITINQGGTQKGTFTVNQSGNTTINLDAGGGGGGGTVDQTFDGTSTNAQSGVAIQGELSTNYQPKLVSGTDIKTINNTSLLGSGNINTSEIFIAQYGITSYTDITTAINDGKLVLCTYNGSTYYYEGSGGGFVSFVTNTVGTNYIITVDSSNNWTNDSRAFPTALSDLTVSAGSNITISGDTISATDTTYSDFTGADSITAGASGLVPAPSAGDEDKILTGGGTWESANTVIGYTPADNTLSNVSSIDSGSAVQSALDGKINKSGDTMTGGLAVEDNIYIKYAGNKYFVVQNTSANYTNTTAPASSVSIGGFLVQDVNGNTFGGSTLAHNASNTIVNRLYARRSIGGTEYTSMLEVGVGATGTPYATAPRTPPTSSNDTNIATTSFVRHLVQSGEVSLGANSEATVTFPYGFPNANVTVVVSRRAGASTTAGLYPCYVRGEPTASSFKVYNPTQGSQTVPWIAVYKG